MDHRGDETGAATTLQAVADLYRPTLDFPKPGIRFWSGLEATGDAAAFRCVLDALETRCRAWMARTGREIDFIAGFDARGFMFGAPIADRLGAGFLQPRKPGKLPPPVISAGYETEYGSDTLEMSRRDLSGRTVVLIDDLLATGGTAEAGRRLIEELGGAVAFLLVVIELPFLDGQARLGACPVEALLREVDGRLTASRG
ncbi:MAG: adenine phosphoribosyltransferase [Pseudomonadota bacterium]